jgi:hypothetical protein
LKEEDNWLGLFNPLYQKPQVVIASGMKTAEERRCN